MKKLKIIGLFLLVHCYVNSYGQDQPALNEINKAESEVTAIDSVISLTSIQKEQLVKVLVEKNRFLSNANMNGGRKNWAIEHNYLDRINLILEKEKGNSAQVKSQAKSSKQADSSIVTGEGILLDEKLLKRLNLNKRTEESGQ